MEALGYMHNCFRFFFLTTSIMSGTVVGDGHPGMRNSPCAQELTEFVICHRDRQDTAEECANVRRGWRWAL